MPDVVAVGAVDAEGKRPPWSPNLDWIDCTALGVDVVADYLDGEVQLTKTEAPFAGFAVWSGTSFAAATVSGAIAARMGSQRVGARQAYEDLLRDSEVVRPFEPRPDSGT
jgi:subtilisin family serine protease